MGLWSTKVAYYAKAARTAYTHRPTDHLLKLCLTINLIILVIYSPSHPSSLPYPYLDIVANSLNARTPSAPILEMSDFRWDRTSELENRHTEVQSLSPPFISHDSLTSQTIQYTQPTDQLSDDQDDWAILAYAAEVKDLEMAERAIRRLSKLGNEQSEAEGGQVSSNPDVITVEAITPTDVFGRVAPVNRSTISASITPERLEREIPPQTPRKRSRAETLVLAELAWPASSRRHEIVWSPRSPHTPRNHRLTPITPRTPHQPRTTHTPSTPCTPYIPHTQAPYPLRTPTKNTPYGSARSQLRSSMGIGPPVKVLTPGTPTKKPMLAVRELKAPSRVVSPLGKSTIRGITGEDRDTAWAR